MIKKRKKEVLNELTERLLNKSGVNCKEESLLRVISVAAVHHIARIVNFAAQRANFQANANETAKRHGVSARLKKTADVLNEQQFSDRNYKNSSIERMNDCTETEIRKLCLRMEDLENSIILFDKNLSWPTHFPI
jgi:hypothetical protein